MTYITPSETGGASLGFSHPGEVLIRKLTASQGARSDYYEAHEATGETAGPSRLDRAAAWPSREPDAGETLRIATAEHLGRLLRECGDKVSELLEVTNDPIKSALLGASLVNLLQELWDHRASREADWVELLNVVQLLLANEDFETLPLDKRRALVALFRDGLSTHTIGPAVVARMLEVLSGAQFDVWRRLEDASANG